MKSLILAVLVALVCLQLQGALARTPKGDAACACERDLPYQLLRGEDQVRQCERGYYCDCKAGKVLRCFAVILTWKYNEDPQVCDLNFDCKKFFENLPTTPATTVTPPATTPAITTRPTTPPTTTSTTPSTTTPTTPPTTTPTTPPTTTPTTPPTTTPTTPPTTTPTTPPTTTPTTPPTTTTRPTTTPSTSPNTESTTATPSTTPGPVVDPYCLKCDPVTHQRYQLIRGDDEVGKCNERLYCDCEERSQQQCGWLTALNPDDQKCEMFFSCESWLKEHSHNWIESDMP
ncbi:hypothetical protein FOCC_FOCC000632 [Frankliniella occidentalis]|uniref:PH domain-containing protein DDB_G0287875-like n=1 Tax=Frankliniella occidentalis TaxID=133901 RepID=A0A6J1S4V1_FRAOC|nr:PH domain-containing protein DDB_G0287875-like [Frankliniella occidentalis]KAE8752510.1 hypothetical protein FOCC_FOCC000632 [Frankliniella occidentalis]